MQLEYEDYKTVEYEVFWYVDLSAMAFTYRVGSLNDDCDATDVKLMRAKPRGGLFSSLRESRRNCTVPVRLRPYVSGACAYSGGRRNASRDQSPEPLNCTSTNRS